MHRSLRSPVVAGVEIVAALCFVAAAIPLLLIIIGVLLWVGTWPAFVRVHDSVSLASSMRAVLPVLVISLIAGSGYFAMLEIRAALVASYYGYGALIDVDPARAIAWILGLEWLVGLAVLAVGCCGGLRNLEVVLGAQDE